MKGLGTNLFSTQQKQDKIITVKLLNSALMQENANQQQFYVKRGKESLKVSLRTAANSPQQ